MKESVNQEGDCKTAPATPGLLNTIEGGLEGLVKNLGILTTIQGSLCANSTLFKIHHLSNSHLPLP